MTQSAPGDPRGLVELYTGVSRALSETVHRVTARHDLTPMQAVALFRVGSETLPVKEIARHLHCDPSNATGLVDQLERRGLVRRTTPPHDRRVRAVEATPQGARVLAGLRATIGDDPTALGRLRPADHRELRRILEILLAPSSADDGAAPLDARRS